MPEWFAWFALACGLAVLAASMLYAREVFRLRAYNRFAKQLHERGRAARSLPDADQVAELRAISQAFRDYQPGKNTPDERSSEILRRGIL